MFTTYRKFIYQVFFSHCLLFPPTIELSLRLVMVYLFHSVGCHYFLSHLSDQCFNMIHSSTEVNVLTFSLGNFCFFNLLFIFTFANFYLLLLEPRSNSVRLYWQSYCTSLMISCLQDYASSFNSYFLFLTEVPL